MKNIIRVLHVVGAMNRAGAESMIMNIYRNLDRDKVQFDFIYFTDKSTDYDEEIKALGGRIINLSSPSKVGIIKSIFEIKAAIKKYGPYDVIHSHTLFNCGISAIAGWLSGINVRISHAHTTLDSSRSFLRGIYFAVMRISIKLFSTKYLACSRLAAQYLFGTNVIKSDKYEWFPNLIEYERFVKVDQKAISETRDSLNLKGTEVVIGHIGRFVAEKNHKFIIEILKELSKKQIEYTAIFIGEGPLREAIEKLGEGLNIKFLGIREDVPQLLHCMDIFILPSIYEGLGLVLLEAQACGVPCVTSEAVQNEADLEIKLVTKLSLKEDISLWVNKIIGLKHKEQKDINFIKASFEDKGYSVTKGVERLIDIYLGKKSN